MAIDPVSAVFGFLSKLAEGAVAMVPVLFPDAEERRRRELAKALKRAAKASQDLDRVIAKYGGEAGK